MSNQCSVPPASPVKVFRAWPKLRVDLLTYPSVIEHMDESTKIDPGTARLINELLARLGVMMEDASPTALLSGSCEGRLSARVRLLDLEIGRMQAISAAARTLLNG